MMAQMLPSKVSIRYLSDVSLYANWGLKKFLPQFFANERNHPICTLPPDNPEFAINTHER
jgi:hypothetical protein